MFSPEERSDTSILRALNSTSIRRNKQIREFDRVAVVLRSAIGPSRRRRNWAFLITVLLFKTTLRLSPFMVMRKRFHWPSGLSAFSWRHPGPSAGIVLSVRDSRNFARTGQHQMFTWALSSPRR